MTKYQRSVGGGGEPVEGYPRDFKEYSYEPLLREGRHKGILLMVKEESAVKYRAVVGIACTRNGDPADPSVHDTDLVQVNHTMKTGTGWFDNLVDVLTDAQILDLREGEDLSDVDWRACRGAIVEVDVVNDVYTPKDGGDPRDTNKIKRFLRARKSNTGRGREADSRGRNDDRGRSNGRDDRGRDGRSREREEPRRSSREQERDRRAGPNWNAGGDDRGGERGRDERSRPRDDDRRDREPAREGKTYGGREEQGHGVPDEDLPF
jgi:hypothetical protein